MHGIGTYTWNDGRKYTGDWIQGKMNGDGAFQFSDGRTYKGNYYND